MNTFYTQTSKYAKQMALFLILFLSVFYGDFINAADQMIIQAHEEYESGEYSKACETYCLFFLEDDPSTEWFSRRTIEDYICAYVGKACCEYRLQMLPKESLEFQLNILHERLKNSPTNDPLLVENICIYTPYKEVMKEIHLSQQSKQE